MEETNNNLHQQHPPGKKAHHWPQLKIEWRMRSLLIDLLELSNTHSHSREFFPGRDQLHRGDKFRCPPQGPLLRRQFGQIYALRVDAPWSGKSVNLRLKIWRFGDGNLRKFWPAKVKKTRGIPDMEVVFVCWPIYYISICMIYVYIYIYICTCVYHCHLVPIS